MSLESPMNETSFSIYVVDICNMSSIIEVVSKKIKDLITWWVSARAEISLRPPGWNIVVITCSISARERNVNFREKVYWGAKTVSAHPRVPFSARAEIPFRLHETFSYFQARLVGLKILARFENTGLGFSFRVELRPGLNPSPCNRQFGFQRICFRSRAETSARLAGLKFEPGVKFAM